MGQITPLSQSAVHTLNEIWDAWELKVRERRDQGGGGDSACCFRAQVGARRGGAAVWGAEWGGVLAASFLSCALNAWS